LELKEIRKNYSAYTSNSSSVIDKIKKDKEKEKEKDKEKENWN
jgi:hypothetical protein